MPAIPRPYRWVLSALVRAARDEPLTVEQLVARQTFPRYAPFKVERTLVCLAAAGLARRGYGGWMITVAGERAAKSGLFGRLTDAQLEALEGALRLPDEAAHLARLEPSPLTVDGLRQLKEKQRQVAEAEKRREAKKRHDAALRRSCERVGALVSCIIFFYIVVFLISLVR